MTTAGRTTTLSVPEWHRATRIASGGLCSAHGLFLLVKLPSAGITAGEAGGDWPRWWAAVVQFDGGLLLALGVLARPAVWACVVALTITGSHHQAPVVFAARAQALAELLLGLALVLLAARRDSPLTPRTKRSRARLDWPGAAHHTHVTARETTTVTAKPPESRGRPRGVPNVIRAGLNPPVPPTEPLVSR